MSNDRRALLAAVASQQQQIQALTHQNRVLALQVGYVANLAGVGKQVEAIKKKADADNPAQPVPNPPSEQPFETTEQAVTPETMDDVRRPGLTPGSVNNLAADTTDVALAPGESLPTAPYNELQEVTAPVAGTETQLPLEQTRIETDVRVGDPMNPEIAFPWISGPNNSNGGTTASGGNRTMASIRLARLQIQAGIARGDDLGVAAMIENSEATDEQIATATATLEQVSKSASRQAQARPAHLVPRSASVQRTTPSLAGGDAPLVREASSVSDDTADADLFD